MVGLLLAVVLVMTAAADGRAEPPRHRSLAGRLLVASDALRDPRFVRTVIYVVRHDAKGAFGLVVNWPVTEVPFEQALTPFGLQVPPGSGNVRVHYGGPVDKQRGFVLHTADWTVEGTAVVDGRFALTEDPRVLQEIARGAGPRKALFFLGHAGWAPGQLERERAAGAWGVATADERIVFDEDPNQKWIEATTRRLLDM